MHEVVMINGEVVPVHRDPDADVDDDEDGEHDHDHEADACSTDCCTSVTPDVTR